MARVSFGPFPQYAALTALQRDGRGRRPRRGHPRGLVRCRELVCPARASTGWLAVVDDAQRERLEAASKACETTVFWHAKRTPGEVLRAVADAADELGIDRVGRLRREGVGRADRGGGGRAPRQAGRGVLPQRDHGPAGGPAGLVRPHRLQARGDPRPVPPAQARGRRPAPAARVRVRPPHRGPADREGRRPPPALARSRRRADRAAPARRRLPAPDVGGADRAVRDRPRARRPPACRRRPHLGVAALLGQGARGDRRPRRQHVRLLLQGPRRRSPERRWSGPRTSSSRPARGAAGWAAPCSTSRRTPSPPWPA